MQIREWVSEWALTSYLSCVRSFLGFLDFLCSLSRLFYVLLYLLSSHFRSFALRLPRFPISPSFLLGLLWLIFFLRSFVFRLLWLTIFLSFGRFYITLTSYLSLFVRSWAPLTSYLSLVYKFLGSPDFLSSPARMFFSFLDFLSPLRLFLGCLDFCFPISPSFVLGHSWFPIFAAFIFSLLGFSVVCSHIPLLLSLLFLLSQLFYSHTLFLLFSSCSSWPISYFACSHAVLLPLFSYSSWSVSCCASPPLLIFRSLLTPLDSPPVLHPFRYMLFALYLLLLTCLFYFAFTTHFSLSSSSSWPTTCSLSLFFILQSCLIFYSRIAIYLSFSLL